MAQIVHGNICEHEEQNVLMEIFAKRLKERAKQLGISNAEVARQAGLEERRYGHYVSGRREPNLAILKKIAEVLGITPNWLLGVSAVQNIDTNKAELIERFANVASQITTDELELCVIQAEAIIMAKRNADTG